MTNQLTDMCCGGTGHAAAIDCSDAPVGLRHVLEAAVQNVHRRGTEPLLVAGPAGSGKSTCCAALAGRLGRPVLVLDVATSELRKGQRHRIADLHLVPRAVPVSEGYERRVAPLIVIEQVERLPGGLAGGAMAALVSIATQKFPRALEYYFAVESDWEDVIFAFTTRATVGPTLRSKLHVVELPGYVQSQKLAIAVRAFEAVGRQAPIAWLKRWVELYLSRPGMNDLTRVIRVTRTLSEPEMDPERIASILGAPTRSSTARDSDPNPGEAVALASTHDGGAALLIEACFGSAGDGDLTMTGNLGEAIQGAARIALHVVNEHLDPAQRLGAARSRPVLINLPGNWTVQKGDGQSLGLAMAIAMYGLATGRSIRRRHAVTGELGLSGLVLPVQNCMARLIAAEHNGVECVVFPEANRPISSIMPAPLRPGLRVAFVHSFRRALPLMLS